MLLIRTWREECRPIRQKDRTLSRPWLRYMRPKQQHVVVKSKSIFFLNLDLKDVFTDTSMQKWHLGPTQAPTEHCRIRHYTRRQHWAQPLPDIVCVYPQNGNLLLLCLYCPTAVRLYHPALKYPHHHVSSLLFPYKPHRSSMSLRGRDMAAMKGRRLTQASDQRGGFPVEKQAHEESHILMSCRFPPLSMLSVGWQLFFIPFHPIPCT